MHTTSQGRFMFGGCDTVELAKKYGTPLYVVDEDMIRSAARKYTHALASCYPNSQAIYAGKAFLPMWMCGIVKQEGLGLDVASGGELFTALKAGFPAGKIFFHGNNKSLQEVEMALEAGVGRFVVDNWFEIRTLSAKARQKGLRPDILLRVAPGVEADTHSYIETGQQDSKFGFDLTNGQAQEAVQAVLNEGTLNLKGLHCHIGSQVTSFEGPALAAKRMVDFVCKLKDTFGYEPLELNLGGGLGIAYTDTDVTPSIDRYVRGLATVVTDCISDANSGRPHDPLKYPKLYLEPGRSIVGEAGITLYTAGAVKHIPGVRTYVSVDGGMADNPRPALYNAVYRAVVANKAAESATGTVCISGKCCETDTIIQKAVTPSITSGDIVAVLCTGAYCYSMASNYNMLPRPAVVAVSKGSSTLIVRRQSYQDLLNWDVLSPDCFSDLPVSRAAAGGAGAM